ncbi:MAG: phosphatidylglycerophosphatase A [bacterium]|nr:MAG: phosphatidylglycerophosphatase A [bacterium]
MRDLPVRVLATGLGAGYSPFAPGTAGTVVAIPLFLLLSQWGSWGVFAGLAITAAVGVPLAGRMEVLTGVKDPKPVVIDEIAGYLLTMIGSPPDALHVLSGFFLFRVFDVLKPPPVRSLERAFAGGLGVVADDLMAGAYSWACLWILRTYLF